MTTPNAPATIGRERICEQCGSVYRSPRSSSRYCSDACRKQASRGVAPKAGPNASLTIITKALVKLGMVGPIGPVTQLGLTVSRADALNELAFIFNRKGWGRITVDEFDAALKDDGVRTYDTASTEATQRKRFQDRQRIARARHLKAA